MHGQHDEGVQDVCPVAGLLAQSEDAKKLTGYEMIVTKKRKLKDENQREKKLSLMCPHCQFQQQGNH